MAAPAPIFGARWATEVMTVSPATEKSGFALVYLPQPVRMSTLTSRGPDRNRQTGHLFVQSLNEKVARAGARPALLAAAVDQFDAVAVGILDEAEPGAAVADAVRLALGLDPLIGQAGEGLIEVVDGEGDVPVAGADVVRPLVVVQRQLELFVLPRDPEEVVRRLELAIPHDRQLAAGFEAERLVERPALGGVGDAVHRVQEARHARIVGSRATGVPRQSPAALSARACTRGQSATPRRARRARPRRRWPDPGP